ncbi:hydroxymethylglutaryl-CoA lyase [Limibacter armeniacum]|uniref:hydroxymethylglutaryl-CoA lyase n=1 Tax=Limibacter armeniacum TaxID=466084 RepID=UPI002FE614AD
MKIIECPRDAMQGLDNFIPTADKAKYISALMKVGFHTIDFGSFVSPKAIPQMKDTAEVLELLDFEGAKSRLLAIVANFRGAQDAMEFDEIAYIGFPLSISETFQQRNTNKSIDDALEEVKQMKYLSGRYNRELVVYLSMGFGNPYDEPYSPAIVAEFVGKLAELEIDIVSLADTIGVAKPELITSLFTELIPAYPDIEFGAHLHSTPATAYEKVKAAYEAGCRRIDTAMGGMGGCPMAKEDLTGNLATETLVEYLKSIDSLPNLDMKALEKAAAMRLELISA